MESFLNFRRYLQRCIEHDTILDEDVELDETDLGYICRCAIEWLHDRSFGNIRDKYTFKKYMIYVAWIAVKVLMMTNYYYYVDIDDVSYLHDNLEEVVHACDDDFNNVQDTYNPQYLRISDAANKILRAYDSATYDVDYTQSAIDYYEAIYRTMLE